MKKLRKDAINIVKAGVGIGVGASVLGDAGSTGGVAAMGKLGSGLGTMGSLAAMGGVLRATKKMKKY